MSLSSHNFKKTAALPPMAVFLDFDGVVHQCESLDNEAKISRKNKHHDSGIVTGKLIDEALLTKIDSLAIKLNIPCFILTVRPPSHLSYILETVKKACTFGKGLGGFHEDNIICLGIEKTDKYHNKSTLSLKNPKVKSIEDKYKTQFAHLAKDQIVFCDDESKHIDPVKDAGFKTILAEVDNTTHLESIVELLQLAAESTHKKSAYKCFSSTLFIAPSYLDETTDDEKETQTPTNDF